MLNLQRTNGKNMHTLKLDVKLHMMPIALLFNKDSAIKFYFAVLKKLQHVMRF